MLPPRCYLTLCREKAQAEAADSELPVCTHLHTTMELLDLSASTALAGPGQANVTKCPAVGQSCPFMSPRADWSFEDHSKLQTQWLPKRIEAGEQGAERLPQMYCKDTASGSLSSKTADTKKPYEVVRNLAHQIPVQVTWTSTGEG